MNMMAHHVVARESTLAAPRGPKAVWLPAPPNAPARSAALPLWSSTTTISTKQLRMKNVVSSHGAHFHPAAIKPNPIRRAMAHFITLGIMGLLDLRAKMPVSRLGRDKFRPPLHVIHDRGEGFRLQARSAHKRSVQFFLRHQAVNVVRLDAAAVEDAQSGGGSRGKLLRPALTEEPMRCGRDLRCRRAARSDGPHRLVRYQNTRELLGGQRTGPPAELLFQDGFGVLGFARGQRFADADDRRQTSNEGGFRLLGDGLVGFPEVLAAFRVADDDVTATRFDEHAGGNFAGEGAFFFPVKILRGNRDLRAARKLGRGGEGCKRRSDDDVAVRGVRDKGCEGGEKGARVRLCLVHLPVAGDDAAANRIGHLSGALEARLFVSASTPGSLRPARNSSEAPPPVEMWEILSATPD